MIRRFTGALLMGTILQLTALDLRAECERHAKASRAKEIPGAETGVDTGVSPGVGTGTHDHHADHAAATNSSDPGSPSSDTDGAPAPKCCMVAGTCSNSAFASIILSDHLQVAPRDAASLTAALRPASPVRAPEPPPPRA